MQQRLGDAFADYLIDGRRADLAQALRTAGVVGPAELLVADPSAVATLSRRWSAPWRARPCLIGELPPRGAAPWSLWFDPREVTLMTLVPRPAAVYAEWPDSVRQDMTPFVGWLSVERTRRWQVLGWARQVGIELSVDWTADREPAEGLTGSQAVRYAAYFDKSLASPFAWTAVHGAGEPLSAALWPPEAGPELAGYIAEGQLLVQRRARALVPDTEEPDEDDPTCVVEEFDPLNAVGFRTAISSQRHSEAAR